MSDEAPDGRLPVDLDQMFELARAGADLLLEFVDDGVPVDHADAAGNTLLMLAAYHGHAGLVRGLAERGADVDRHNARGQAPLAGAVFKGAHDVVAVLVAAGADPDAGTPSARETAAMFERTLPRSPSAPGPGE